jgi:5-methyltetrahydrofolate--homocysteine methyltransferase
VIDLGIKVPPAALIEAAVEHRPDAIGLSGLLVKSAQQMVVTVEDLSRAGIGVPVLVGGAALSERFTATRIAAATESLVVYAKDAMEGLSIANSLLSPRQSAAFREEVLRAQARLARGGSASSQAAVATAELPERSPAVPILEEVPAPPDLDIHLELGIGLEELYSYVNPQMIFCRHLGLRGNFLRKRDAGDAKALELEGIVLGLLRECIREKLLTPRAMWRFFPVSSTSRAVTFHAAEEGGPSEIFAFPRQRRAPYHSICDYVAPARAGAPVDHAAMLVTTCGAGVRERASAWLERGEYLRAHTLQVLALELAEAFAEWVHAKIRTVWGFPDPPDLSRLDLFRARYRGKRYSFGYPACPDLSEQQKLWRLMRPDDHIGVELTDGYMMDPEASVSALVFHHPAATYFGVGQEEG